MAAVIRDAQMGPDTVVIAVVAARAEERGAEAVTAKRPAAAQWTRPAGEPAPVPPAPVIDETAQVAREALEQAAREQREKERHAALERAQAEGYAAGVAQAEARHAAQAAELGALLTSAHAAIEAVTADAEDVIVEIAYESVCKILGDALCRREGVVAVVRTILQGLRERERLLIRVAPSDLALLESGRKEIFPKGDNALIELVGDERVNLGGCLVETAGGTLDGRLETQMQRLRETLLSARRMHTEGLA